MRRTNMKRSCQIVMLLLLSVPPVYGQGEAQLKAFFEGKTVRVKMDMPGSSDGVDVSPENKPEIEYKEYTKRLGKFGVAVKKGDSIMVTHVKVKGDMIEFHLGGGGLGFQRSGIPRPRPIEKSERETGLEIALNQERDPARRREIQQELAYLRREREIQNQRQQERAERISEDVQRRRQEG